jgi:hypothetical protein
MVLRNRDFLSNGDQMNIKGRKSKYKENRGILYSEIRCLKVWYKFTKVLKKLLSQSPGSTQKTIFFINLTEKILNLTLCQPLTSSVVWVNYFIKIFYLNLKCGLRFKKK